MPADSKKSGNLPGTFRDFVQKFPALAEAHEQIAKSIDGYGPLDRKICELIKIGISLGAGLESATKSHVRRALEAGASQQEIEQAILLTMNTCGFPRTVMGWKWAIEQLDRDRRG